MRFSTLPPAPLLHIQRAMHTDGLQAGKEGREEKRRMERRQRRFAQVGRALRMGEAAALAWNVSVPLDGLQGRWRLEKLMHKWLEKLIHMWLDGSDEAERRLSARQRRRSARQRRRSALRWSLLQTPRAWVCVRAR
jgi:hypothetical protein